MKKKSIHLSRRRKVKRSRRKRSVRRSRRLRTRRKIMDGYVINVDTNYTPYGCKAPKSIY
jgi:hypothetical protein